MCVYLCWPGGCGCLVFFRPNLSTHICFGQPTFGVFLYSVFSSHLSNMRKLVVALIKLFKVLFFGQNIQIQVITCCDSGLATDDLALVQVRFPSQ